MRTINLTFRGISDARSSIDRDTRIRIALAPTQAASIDVLVPRGQTAQVQPWRYDLGHGYCRYEFFAQRPHRLACARCD